MSTIVFRGAKYTPLVVTALRARKSPKPAIGKLRQVASKYYQSAQYAAQKFPNLVADKLDQINAAFTEYYDDKPEQFGTILDALKQNGQALQEASKRMGPMAQQADDLWARIVQLRQRWEDQGADPHWLEELDEVGQLLFYGGE